MPTAELKTRPTARSVSDFIDAIDDDERRRDCRTVHDLMRRIAHAEPRMWGSSIVGFGDQRYRYASGREGDWFLVGFSPRKQNLTLYLSGGFANVGPLLAELGKHTTGKGCLYLRSLEDIHLPVLERLIARAVESGVRAHKAASSGVESKAPSRRKRSAGAPRARATAKATTTVRRTRKSG